MKRFVYLYLLAMVLLSCIKTTNESVSDVADCYGAIVKRDSTKKTVYFIFSADSLFEGADTILRVLDKHSIKGSFFFTGNCLRMPEHQDKISRIISGGHYVGGHSDKHILYADWDKERTNMVSDDSLKRDISANYVELERFGITKDEVPYFLPPYEWYNEQNIKAIKDMGLVPVNFTTGLYTSDDYTTPDMANYKSSQALIDVLMRYEETHTLNGSIILIHPGTSPLRTDKLYHRLDEIITSLKSKGYQFDRLK